MAIRRKPYWRRPIDWMRVVLPPTWIVALIVCGVFGWELMAHVIVQRAPFDPTSFRSFQRQLHAPLNTWVIFSLVAYSVYRACAMNPVYRPTYADWLYRTPWHRRLPLPLGPIHLVWQDAVVVLAATLLLMHTAELTWHDVIAIFLFPYLLMLLPPLRIMGATAHAYATAYALVACVALNPRTVQGTIALAMAYLIAWNGLPLTLRGPVHEVLGDAWETWRMMVSAQKNQPTQQKIVGYPLFQLAPRLYLPSISIREALVASWLPAALLFALTRHISEPVERQQIPVFVSVILLAFAIVTRSGLYFAEYRSPIGLFGRIATGRWIIWGFDRAWLPMAGVVGLNVVALGITRCWPAYYVGPINLGLGLTMLTALPPSLKDWALIGNHRTVPNPFMRSSYIEH